MEDIINLLNNLKNILRFLFIVMIFFMGLKVFLKQLYSVFVKKSNKRINKENL